ncbi:uncharacterized protein TNCT_6071 [Trichonephila clavata]|uniref:DUF6570 domain-containing protein n=1 Tax=Trichonephila clavata TaxID=2740835 RepID=A0A8X6FW45_TRICU|nr:uncharacterized protein TNCT_6071 [Trichonephila clavata]
MLPRTSDNAGTVVFTERLENINVTRQFSISRQKVYNALYWIVANNPLYKDVTIDQNVVINEEDIIRAEETPAEMAEETNGEATEDTRAYMRMNDFSRIVRASWHQANDSLFISGFAGVQCCAMGCKVRNGEKFCGLSCRREWIVIRAKNFNVIKNDLGAFNRRFQINFDEEPRIYGNLNDQVNQANFGHTLRQGIDKLFEDSNAGILISEGRSFEVMHYDNKYYFSGSHSCGAGMSQCKGQRKGLYYIECDNVVEFVRIRKRATRSKNV